jgi:hypothetical protein
MVKTSLTEGYTTYEYRVVNGSAFPITTVLLGFDGGVAQPELPLEGEVLSGATIASPDGWSAVVYPLEADTVGHIAWEIEQESREIPGGTTCVGFVVTVPTVQPRLGSAHWTVYVNGDVVTSYTDTLIVDDGTVDVIGRIGGEAAFRISPNPMRSSASIAFGIHETGMLVLQVYDNMGRRVSTLMTEPVTPGSRISSWNGRDDKGRRVPPGLYFVRLKTPSVERFARITVLR